MCIKNFLKVTARAIFICMIVHGPLVLATVNSFSYEGRLYDSAGNPLNAANVIFRLEVFSETGGCLLYQESHAAQNLSSAISHEQGVFSLKVGTGTRGSNDPGLNFIDVFKNSGPLVGYSGCNYTPTATDIRHLRVYVDSGSGFEVLSPDFDLLSAPGTMVAQSLQGKAASEFIQVSGSVSQVNVAALVGGGDAGSLHHHDASYVKLGSAGAQNLGSGTLYTTGQVGIGTSTPTAGVELHVRDSASVATVKIEGAAAAGSKIVFNDAAVERAAINTEGGTAALVISTAGITALRIDASQNAMLTGSLIMDGILRVGQVPSGSAETNMTTDLTNNCGAGCSGGTWYRSDTGEYRIWDNSKGTRTIVAYDGTPSNNDVLQWNGTKWLPAAVGSTDPTKLSLTGGIVTGAVTITGALSAGSLGTGAIAATSLNAPVISAATVIANTVTVSLAAAAGTDAVNKNYSDTYLAGRSIPTPLVGDDGKSLRWNNSTGMWDYFSSLSAGMAGTQATENSLVPNCLSTEKLQMSAGPIYSYTCITDNSTDPSKLPLAGGTITGGLSVAGAVTIGGNLVTNNISANTITVSMAPSGNLDGINKAYSDTHLGSRSLVGPSVGNDGQSVRWNNSSNAWEYFTADVAGAGVTAFNSRTGVVSPAANDYTWAQIDKSTSSIADLTTRSASDLSTGTLSDVRLSSNVVRANTANSFSVGNQLITNNAGSNRALIVQGAVGQSVSLMDWRDSSSTVLYSLQQSGAPSNATDLVNKNYVDSRLSGMTLPASPGPAQSGQSLRWNNSNLIWEYFTPTAGTVNSVSSTGAISISGAANAPVVSVLTATGTNLGVVQVGNGLTETLGVVSVAYGTLANTALQGNITLAGDVTGTVGAITITKIQSRDISSAFPADGDYLKFSSGTWSPAPLSLSPGSIGSAEIADETIQSADILDGTISSADITDGTITSVDVASIAIAKISGTGSMCTQDQSAVNITGGSLTGISSLNISNPAGSDLLTVASTGPAGGGILVSSAGGSSDAYLDLRDGTGTVGSVKVLSGVMRVYNLGIAGANTLELGAGGTTPVTKIQLQPASNQVNFNNADLNQINKINMTGSLTVAGYVQTMNGTATAPALRLSGNNAGFYSPAVNEVALSTSGTARLYINAAGGTAISTSGSTSDFFEVNGGMAATPMNGRNITLVAESAGAGNYNGGNIILDPGLPSGTGTAGKVNIFGQTNINGPIVLTTASTAISTSGTPCTPSNQCINHANNASIVKLTATSAGNVGCITKGVSDGQVLYIYVNSVVNLAFNNNQVCTGGGNFATILFNTAPAAIAGSGYRYLQLIYDASVPAWRLISSN